MLNKRGTGTFNSSFKRRLHVLHGPYLFWIKDGVRSHVHLYIRLTLAKLLKPAGYVDMREPGLVMRCTGSELELKCAGKTYILQANSPEEMSEWLLLIVGCDPG